MSSLLPPGLKLIDCEEYNKTDDRKTKLDAGDKIVYFIRHGQSVGNVARRDERFSDACYDAPLTEHGQLQARKLQEYVERWGVQKVYSSPLTRALQTTCLAFERLSQPIVAWPMVTEFYPHMPECRGRNRDELEQMLLLTTMSRFKDVQMDGVYDQWWHAAGDRHFRLSSFFQWLATCPETKIAVVCHWGFLNETLLNEAKCQSRLELHNCSWIRTVWSTPISPKVSRPISNVGDKFSLVLVPSGAITKEGMGLLDKFRKFRDGIQKDESLSKTSCLQYTALPYILLASFGPIVGEYTVGLVNHALFLFADSIQELLNHEEQHSAPGRIRRTSRWTLAHGGTGSTTFACEETQEVSLPLGEKGVAMITPLLTEIEEILRAEGVDVKVYNKDITFFGRSNDDEHAHGGLGSLEKSAQSTFGSRSNPISSILNKHLCKKLMQGTEHGNDDSTPVECDQVLRILREEVNWELLLMSTQKGETNLHTHQIVLL
eukprot:m.123250 g.123250  ORF g.123250 m.123250 type:complete len:489 (+) comp9404_c1_seq9:111-1577(+)